MFSIYAYPKAGFKAAGSLKGSAETRKEAFAKADEFRKTGYNCIRIVEVKSQIKKQKR